ncbi:hypothetical protein [Agrobacterium vitis]|uniref:hypothetical protein n=1 Tax=Agrobacterium vitis TaxID=373 RepID=UPI0015D9EA99|nr:hypothetical protein [Agrobacterium vitis]
MLDGAEEPPPPQHPNLAKYYHDEIAALHGQLSNDETRALAANKLRALVSRGGSVCLNSSGRFVKWISTLIMPPPSSVSAR